jgi:hypothetical protein
MEAFMVKATEELNKSERTEVRKKRRESVARLNKVALNLETEVRKSLAAQAREAGMGLTPFINKVLENQVMDNAPAGDEQAERLRARRAVLDYVVGLARQSDANGEFDEHVILSVMKTASQDADFMVAYETATGTEGRGAKKAKIALNQQLGRLIKQATSAKSKRDGAGKIQRAQVQDEIVTSYTLLQKAEAA